MNSGWISWPRAAWGCCLVALTAAGCGGPNELESPTAHRLKGLATMYLGAAITSGGASDEQALKRYLRIVDTIQLTTSGIDPNDRNAIFTSLRDNEPFVVRYGIAINNMSGNSAPLLAHEKSGKNGKRLVVYANAKVDLVDDKKLQDLIEGKHLQTKQP